MIKGITNTITCCLNKFNYIGISPIINQSLKYFHNNIEGIKAPNKENYLIQFTCAKCDYQITRLFTKHAYHKGLVLIKCGGCSGIHLIADNIGWFNDNTTNIEQILSDKGIPFNKSSIQDLYEITKEKLNERI